MKRILALALIAACTFGTSAPAAAQDLVLDFDEDPSHALLPDGPGDGNLQDRLRERFKLRDQHQGDMNRLQELIEIYRRNPNPDALKKYLEQNPLSPDQMERWKKFAETKLDSTNQPGNIPPPSLDKLREDIKSYKPPPPKPTPNNLRPPSTSNEKPPIPNNQRSEKLMKWAERNGLDQSDAVRDAVRDLSAGEFGDLSGESWWNSSEDLDWMKQEGTEFSKWVQEEAGDPRDWDLSGEDFNLSGFGKNFPDANLPSTGGSSSAPSGEGSWIPVIALVVFAAGGLAAWWYLSRPDPKAKADPKTAAITDWPVSPERIRSTDELIRAFEHLALSRIGEPARTWHHNAVAAGLTFQDPAHGASATELAQLYAHARYAPADEPLSAAQVSAARRNLQLLAGGPA